MSYYYKKNYISFGSRTYKALIICLIVFLSVHNAQAQQYDSDELLSVYDDIYYQDTQPLDNDTYYNRGKYKAQNPTQKFKPQQLPEKREPVNTPSPSEDYYYYDDLEVYETEEYANPEEGKIHDNDTGYYYEGGKFYARPKEDSYSPYDDLLSVYDEDVYTEDGYVDNDDAYANIKGYDPAVKEYAPIENNEGEVIYYYENDTIYKPLNTFEGDADQMRDYYSDSLTEEQRNNYDPGKEFYPDYYDYY